MWARCRRESILLLLLNIVVHTLQPSHAIRSVARDGAFVGYSEREKVVDYSHTVTGALPLVFHRCLVAGCSITCTSVQEKSSPVGPGQLHRNMYSHCVRLRCCGASSTCGCCHDMQPVCCVLGKTIVMELLCRSNECGCCYI